MDESTSTAVKSRFCMMGPYAVSAEMVDSRSIGDSRIKPSASPHYDANYLCYFG